MNTYLKRLGTVTLVICFVAASIMCCCWANQASASMVQPAEGKVMSCHQMDHEKAQSAPEENCECNIEFSFYQKNDSIIVADLSSILMTYDHDQMAALAIVPERHHDELSQPFYPSHSNLYLKHSILRL